MFSPSTYMDATNGERELLYSTGVILIHWTKKLEPPVGLMAIQLKWSQVNWFGVFETDFDVKSATITNLQTGHYFKALMLDGWEVRLYTI